MKSTLIIQLTSEHGYIIATNHPYKPDEEWESTFICEPHQFVKLKFDSMEITDIANDILKIQFMTSELSKLNLLTVSFLKLISYIDVLELRYYYDLRYIIHFVKLYEWHDTSFPVVKILFRANNVKSFDQKEGYNVQPLNYHGFRLRVQCSCK